jgi:SAM-dependent methyltransferase
MFPSTDFIIIFEQETKNDAQIIETILCNESFTTNKIDFSELNFESLESVVEKQKGSVIIFLTSDNSSREHTKYINGLMRGKPNSILYLIKEVSIFEEEPETTKTRDVNIIYYQKIARNNIVLKKINELIDKNNLVDRTFSNVDRMSDYKKTLQIYSDPKFALTYFEKWRNKIPEEKLLFFCTLIQPGGRILDAGCGPGHHSVFVANLNYDVIGIDLSKAAIKIAKRNKTSRTEFYHMDMMKVHFGDEFFHGVWSCSSAMHLPRSSLPKLFKEYQRILVKGGVLAVTLPIGERQHFDVFGRFFESFPQTSYIQTILSDEGFEMLTLKSDLSWQTTQNDLRVANWVTFYARKSL